MCVPLPAPGLVPDPHWALGCDNKEAFMLRCDCRGVQQREWLVFFITSSASQESDSGGKFIMSWPLLPTGLHYPLSFSQFLLAHHALSLSFPLLLLLGKATQVGKDIWHTLDTQTVVGGGKDSAHTNLTFLWRAGDVGGGRSAGGITQGAVTHEVMNSLSSYG